MTDTTQAAAAAKPKKQQVAIRDWINPAGQPLETGKESDATGARYIHLPSAKRANANYNPETDPAPADSVFEKQFPGVGEPVTVDLLMYGIFGAHTLWGNVVNTAVNGPKGDPNINPISLISARDADISDGKWSDREAGVGGVRYEKDKLAAAIAQAKGESDPAPYLAKMDNKVDPKSGAVVASDAKGAISYGAYALRNAKVKAAYDALTGGGTAIDSL